MRAVIAGVVNLFRLVVALIAFPFRLLGRPKPAEYIRYRLEGDPPYRPTKRRGLLSSMRKKPEPSTVSSVAQLAEQLKALAADPTIKGVVFDLESLEIAPAKREAIGALIRDLRAAGKKAIGFAVTATTAEYPLLCEMDQILMSSAGRLDLTGFAAEATAAGAAFRKLGIGAHFVRRGEHKTAPELFTEERISPNVRGLLSRLLEERYRHLIEIIATRRGMSEAQAQAKIDQGPYSARRALAEGLCDGIVSEAQLPEFLKRGTVETPAFVRRTAPPETKAREKAEAKSEKDREVRLVHHGKYARQRALRAKWMPVRSRPRVGLVKVEGMIVSGEGGRGIGSFAGATSVVKALRSASRDARVESVLIYVNSGGGSAVASELILEEARRVQRRKPVIAYFDRVAASGGYMAMLGADEIWGGPLSLVGSIGVFAGKFEAGQLLARLGVEREVISFGQNAGLLSTTRPFTASERAALETEVQETYEAFLDLVAAARGMTREEVHARGEGRVYSAREAMAAGLVDRLGGFDDACLRALALAGEKRREYDVLPFTSARRGLFGLRSNLQELTKMQMWAMWDHPGFPEVPGAAGRAIP